MPRSCQAPVEFIGIQIVVFIERPRETAVVDVVIALRVDNVLPT